MIKNVMPPAERVSDSYLTKVSSLVKLQCLFFLLGFVCLPINLFLTLLYGEKNCKVLPIGTRKRLFAHFFWLTHLVCKWQLLAQEEIFSIK